MLVAIFLTALIYQVVQGCPDISGLGLSNGFIRNYQITASSYRKRNSNNSNPSQARLGIKNSWCGNYFGQANIVDEWLQVDFEKPVIVKAVATQGDPNDVTSFVKSFSLEVSDDGKIFNPMNDTAGTKKVFNGNTDNNGVKFNWISSHVTTRYVRFRAAQINRANDGSVCVRLEFYGCQAGTDFRDGKYLYPVGMENKQIQDGSFSASSQQIGKDAKFARLNDAKSWCASSASDQWLQVDLGNVYTITAITTQGSGDKDSCEFVTSYTVAYSTSSPSSLSNLEDFPGRAVVFKATPDTNQEPVMNVMPKTINARYVRIKPWSKGSKSTMYCIRTEIYGYRSDCYSDISSRLGYTITSSTPKSGTVRNAYINSKDTWCANVNDQSQFIKISFGDAMKVSGISIQGNTQGNDWVKTFKVKYKAPCGAETEITTVFDGNADSSTVTIHWFTSIIKTEYLIISPQTWNNNICLRFQIIGCEANAQRIPLGMANGFIPASRLTAFSNDGLNSGPEQARLGVKIRWSGANPGAGSLGDYHQVDFGRVVMLTGLATQGDPESPNDFVKKFYLEISNSSSSFMEVKDCSAVRKDFDGNIDNNGIKYNYFPDLIVTRYVRFYATQLQKTDSTRKVRLRLEYYGMELHGQQAGSKALYPLGMENSIIATSQLTSDDMNSGCCKEEARLNHRFGWCAGTTTDKWIQITFARAMTITAVTMQGHGSPGSPDRTYRYYVQYKDDGASSWTRVKDIANSDKLFTGNKDTQSDPVMDFLPVPVNTKFFRINPQAKGTSSTYMCLRFEVYGYDAECSDDLTKSGDTMITASTYNQNNYPSLAHVNSPVSWCANSADANPYLLIDLGSPKKITGFGVQGDSNGDNWAKQTKISYGSEQCCLTEMSKVFIGNTDRNKAVYNWFSSEIIARFVKIKVHDKNGNACMRVKILGCDEGIRRTALGLTNGLIRNTELSAKSTKSISVDDQSSQARLKITSSWCAASKSQSEWLQVDFGRTVSLTGIATQGDPDTASTSFVGQFYLERSDDGSSFSEVQYIGGRLVFIGNTDKTTINYNWFSSVLETRYVRFRPMIVTGNHVCLRMEYYGAGRNSALANSKDLYPLGMENEAIPDAKITASTQLANDQSFKGRLNAFGWCPTTSDASPYLQIDLGMPLLVVAIATQGHTFSGLGARAREYNLKFSKDGSSTYSDVNKKDSNKQVFVGNVGANNDPVLSFLEVPVKAQIIRVVPTAKGSGAGNWCMRVELYGHHSECSDDITMLKDTRLSASSSKSGKSPYAATIDSGHGWCASTTTTTEYLLIDLGSARRITGVGIQGDSQNDNWATKFKISIGNCSNPMTEMTQEYIANKNRFDVTRHWFPSFIYARYIKFRATAFNGAGPVCMRVQVLGCRETSPKKDPLRTPLGMGNGFIADSQITGTSKHTSAGHDADAWSWDNARLKLLGNRWCSKFPTNYADYVQVDFKEVITLTGVATQGDDSFSNNYVKKYYLEVSYNGIVYADVADKCGTRQVFTGNTNNIGIVYNWLSNPTKARYVRFRATDVSGVHICARLEFYGSFGSKAGSKSLFSLGMENGVISDSQLTSSTAKSGDPPSKGRCNFAGGWCAASGDSSPWLQIDLQQPMVLTAIATQGHGGSGANDRTYKYQVKFKYNSSSAFEFAKNKSNGNMLFTGNYKFQNVPVLNLLPTPVTGQFIRIYPTASGLSSTLKCLRAELYGYLPGCTDDLTALASTRISSSSSANGKLSYTAIIDSSVAWCAATTATTEYILIDLGAAKRFRGVGIQGDSENDNWATKFKISIGNRSNPITEMTQEYIANKNRFDITRHWFPSYIYARFIKFRATAFNGAGPVCMRVQVLGCKEDLPKKDFSRAPLGMGNGFIADAQINGTSIYLGDDNWSWNNARLKLLGNRWCSKQPLNYADYVQVDFKEVITLTGVATQGDDNYDGNYVKKYYLEVSYDGTTFTDVSSSECGTREVFTGNTDHTGIIYNWLSNPTKARYVRFRASDVAGAHICARLEFYGSASSKAGSKDLYSLGMESGVITDSQLTSSTAKSGDPSSKGRFSLANSGWCPTIADTNPWLQIDFGQPMVVTAIATQGHAMSGRTYKYNLKYKKTTSSSLEYAKNKLNGNMLFTGNNKFQSVPVLNLLPVPVTGQILQIYPITAGAGAGTEKCLRTELYGYHPVCHDDLTTASDLSSSSSSLTVRDALVNSRSTWCADTSDTNKHILIDLRAPKMVTGIGIQGDSNNNQWVKTFKLSHARKSGDFTELSKVFIGNADRNSVVRNWLLPPLFTQYLKIKVDTLEVKACMRVQVLGCSKDYDILSKINSVVVNMRKAEVHWSIVNKVSSTFTLQYRKTEDSSWKEVTAISGNTTTLTGLEKHKNYIVRLKSATGILMLKNYVFGGSYSETSTFLVRKEPGVVPKLGTPSNVGSRTFTVRWTQVSQTEKDDWDIQGVQIQYKCLNDPNSADCINPNQNAHNVTDLAIHSYNAPNLKPWTNYSVKLQFYNLVGRGLFSTPITILTKEEAPSDAPVIQSSSVHKRNIDITMSGYPKGKANGKLLGYHVSVRCMQTNATRDCSDTDWKNKTVLDTSKHTITVNGLISWTKYEIAISVYNTAGASPEQSLIFTTLETAPSKAPTGLSAEVKSSSTIDITWTQLKKNDTNGAIIKYIAEVERLDTAQKQTFNATTNFGSVTASGLKAYANYSIKVAAVNKIGTGPFTSTITKETMEAAPGASPTIDSIKTSKFSAELQITNIGKEQVNGVVIGYKLEYTCLDTKTTRLCSSNAAKQVTIMGKAKNSLKLSSLISWTKYKVKILAFNKAGDGPYSGESEFVTKEEAPRLAPTNIILKITGSRSLLLSWDHLSKNDTNGIIINYSVCTQQGANAPICVNISATNDRYPASGLKPYSNYTVKIAAINSAGFGPYNVGITKQTNEEAPVAAPTIQSISTGKFDATLTITNINKNDANGKLLGYYIGYECVNNGVNSRNCSANSKKNVTKHGYPKSTLSVSNLMSWTKYKVTVQVFNSAGGSVKSPAKEEITKQDNPSAAPPNVNVGNTGSRTVTVSWSLVPKSDINGPIVGYEVKLDFFRRGNPTVKITATTDLNVDIGNLFPYTAYNVTVRAKNKVGFGPYSQMKSVTTDEDAPSAPTITNTVPQGTTSIEVRWSPPIDPNGKIRHYELKYCLQPTNCSQIRVPGNKTDKIVENLQTHVNYTFQIRAHTVKYGNWSNNVTEKTIEGIPTKPLNVKIQSYEKSLTLTWTEPAKPRGVILYYKVYGTGRKPYNSSFSQTIDRKYTCVLVQNTFKKECRTSYAVVNLVSGTDYEFEIAAATSKGLGPRSSKTSGSTNVAAAPKPRLQISTSKEIETEVNLTINAVTNYYGPIINYQIIVQVVENSIEKAMTSFPNLLQKNDALAKNLKYFLAKTVDPAKIPFLMSFKPGVALVDALSLELETPGNYLLHLRAVSQRAKGPVVYGNITEYKLERKQMKMLPKPKDKDIGANTIKLDVTINLPKGFVPAFYYVIAVKVTPGKQLKDSASYKPEDLNKYDVTNKGKPYIAAVLSKAEYDAMSEKIFEIGTGKSTTFTVTRRRRMARAVTENYENVPLDSDSTYRAFVMALASKTSYYATPWIPEVETKSPPPKRDETTSSPGGAIAGGVVGAILIIVVVVVIVYFRRFNSFLSSYRKRGNADGTDHFDKIEEQEMKPKLRDTPPRMSHYSNETTDVDGFPTEPTSLEVTKSPMYPPFPAKDIVQVVNRKSAQDDAGFDEEFKNLPKGQLFAWTIGKDLSNKPRNRFANIVPYDYNRIKLQKSQDNCDYINASYVVDYFGQKRYIAAQAPVPATTPNFWTMIWEQQITAIVMLTRCVEGNKRKSEEYWPTEGTEEYGNISVSFLYAEEFPEYVISTFEMKRGNATRTCRHFHYLTWPDHGVPEYPTAILSFRRRVRQFISWEKQGKNPVVVHCSAGVGRTGTFIAIDTLIPLIHKSRIIDVFAYVQLLRVQRPEMVQRLPQYKFIYECLLEAAVCGVTEISAQEYRQRYNNLSNVDAKTGKDGFNREFTSLSFVATDIPDDEFSSARQASNLHKNRDQNVLPRNTQRVFLPAVDYSDGCNYINATFVDGSHKDQFIATQAPVEKTVGDFWRMVIERGTVAIVSLVEINETIPKHWPEYGEAQYDNGNITVQLISSTNIDNNIVHCIFSATDKLFNRSLNEIHCYNFNQWRDHKVPTNVTSLVKVVSEVEAAQRTSNGSPIVVHCGNGAGRTGTFIAAYIILERLKAEQMIDVFQTVRRIRKTRPQFVENREQYKLLYDAVGVYLEQFSTYSNF